MKKIKKSIAVIAALLLMSSGSLHAEPKIAGTENCFGVAVFVYESAIAAGATEWEAFVLSSAAFNTCVENMK
ncbi:MAG: hypothetical protein R2816_01660 [Flavobacteriaceae bacterium]|nr:hypothetical protein [Flavobacteriaceae bacterium]